MSWQLALFFLYITFVTQSLVQRAYSQKTKIPESIPPALSYLFATTPLGIAVGLVLPHHIHWSAWVITLLIIEGIFIGLNNLLAFKAIRLLPIFRFQTIFQSYEIIVIALSWVLLREKLNLFQIVGAVILLCAALVAVRAPKHEDKRLDWIKNRRAIILTVLSAITLGIGLVTEKAALHYMDIGAYFIFGYLTQTIALTSLAVKDINMRSLRSITSYDIRRSLTMGTLSAFVGFSYIFAITKSNNISLITALAAFTLPLTVLASYIFLRERENTKLMWTATALGCIGLIVTTLH